MMDKVKLVMSSRFAAANRALDLKKFHADPQFLGEPVFAPLSRSGVFAKVAGIIGENIPQVNNEINCTMKGSVLLFVYKRLRRST